jgi:hypothetical protein
VNLVVFNAFTCGILTMASVAIGMFFLRFWRDSTDRLFVFFALAFWTMSLHWFLLAVYQPVPDSSHVLFWVRLVGFLLILFGIVDKNLRRGGDVEVQT